MDTDKYIIDSNIFYRGLPFQSDSSSVYYITSEILSEIRHLKKNIDGVNTLILIGKVIIYDPYASVVKDIKNKSKSLGQFDLSKADLSLIALGIQLGYPIISLDYSLINIAKFFSLKTITPGKDLFVTVYSKKYCSICKKIYHIKKPYCEICGNKLILRKFASP